MIFYKPGQKLSAWYENTFKDTNIAAKQALPLGHGLLWLASFGNQCITFAWIDSIADCRLPHMGDRLSPESA